MKLGHQIDIKFTEIKKKSPPTLFWALVVLVTQVPLVLRTLNAFMPVSYGWFGTWAHAGKHLTPYKDYFIPFPILGVWLQGSLPNLFTHYVFAEQVIAGAFWLVLILGQFLLTTLIWKPRNAAIGTIFAAYFYFSWPVLKLATYYEVMLLFLIYGVYFSIIGLQRETKSSKFLFVSGACLAAAPFIKQTAVIPSLCVFLFVGYCIFRQERVREKAISFSTGYALVPFGIFLIAIKQQFLTPMIKAMLTGGGKSPTVRQGLNWGVAQPITSAGWWPWLILLCWVALRTDNSRSETTFKRQVFYVLLLMIFFMGIVSPNSIFSGFAPSDLLGFFLGLFVLSSLLALVISGHSDSEIIESVGKINPLIFVNFLLLFCYIFPSVGFMANQKLQIDVSNLAPTISGQLGLGAVIFTVALFFFSFFMTKSGDNFSSSSIQFKPMFNIRKFPGQIISVFLLTLAFSNSWVAGFTPEAWVVSVGFLITYISSCVDIDLKPRSSKILQVGLFLPFIFFFSVRTITEPYSWWALREPAIETSRHSVPIKSMGGFRLNLTEREQWVRLQKAVSGAPTASIFAGPNIGGVPFMLGREPVFNNCPIIWWDVCPENLAVEDFTWLKMSLPDLIMWSHQPAGVIDGHEQAFRGGDKKSAVAQMQVWIDQQIEAGSYRLTDTIQLSSDNAIMILQRVSDGPK